MNYQYSVIRFLPDIARGEFVNAGVIVANIESKEVHIQLAPNYAHAKHLAPDKLVKEFWNYLRDFKREVESTSKDISDKKFASWIDEITSSDRGMLQFSDAAPIICSEIVTAGEIVAQEFLSGHTVRRPRHRQTKASTTRRIREAYRFAGLEKNRDLFERVTVSGQVHEQEFDFAVRNGQIVQLVQAWNFGVVNTKTVLEHVKAWAFSVEDIREYGGKGKHNGRSIPVPNDVEIRAIYDEPTKAKSREALDEALQAFDKVGAISMSVIEVDILGESAAALLK